MIAARPIRQAVMILPLLALAVPAGGAQAAADIERPAVWPIAAPILEPGLAPVSDDPLHPFAPLKQTPDQTTEPSDGSETSPAPAEPAVGKAPPVHYGDTELPRAVARMRNALMDAARTGQVEELGRVLEQNEMPPTLSFDPVDDPVTFLKQASGDAEGREILALLLEILEAGWVHVDVGTPQEMYVWPYFARWPLDGLSPEQEVELYRILTAFDVDEMRRHGGYIFYRVGIGPDGTLHYFVAGE
ncbi:hypothetical protein [Amorphus sp. 3PC139-8]|uniref:hypothetical protein n=1 Tax=Amorphus sp. 3PC139-8 TaxID=2735676 RepID=UPI00345DD478